MISYITIKVDPSSHFSILKSLVKMEGFNGKPTDLQNILQGDDSKRGLNSSLNETMPTDFDDPSRQYNGISSSKIMDSRNNGDHDLSGRFNAYGGLPNASGQNANDPGFTRQLAPIIGGKYADDDEGFETIDAPNSSTFNHTDPRASELAHADAPTLGEKRSDEPDEERIGIDPSRGKLKMD